ncbi:SsgA family sporulation/cell division regulator [Streptomyces sp. NRRL S-813]|uniref:SsgA family sporulation/cell division regulator n=1 Tax=Streptomyces sp. NRRL S-813 TaxID=1463919 RepID=UPI0004BFE103|nr:SsgA family sporulation/cell division regulator [Streptomyces sp. NRRL S-813]
MNYQSDQLDMALAVAPGEQLTVPARLEYDTDDPFAVSLVFHPGAAYSVTWVMARELLARGLFQPTGQGDVQIRPTGSGPEAELNVILSSPYGIALLYLPLAAVAIWLENTYQLVPEGHEADGLDIDAELARLLHGAA